jgi:phosphatidate phosphatase PAH1
VIAAAGGPVTIVGKFAYGPLSTDLQAERVEVWLDDCSGQYVLEGEAITNGDGRIALELGGEALPVGRYATFLRVAGDSSSVRSTLFVVPPGTRAAVFDIDGTLTSDDLELVTDVLADLFAPILSGDYVPAARPAAGAITGLRDEQGYLLLYLTGRPYWLTGRSREWLAAEGMPVGAVHLADGNGETLPTNAAVGAYKAEYLESLAGLGLEVVMAYGNATTDIYAYAQAGIPVDRTYVLGTNGGQGGTVALGESYEEHLAAAMAEPDASQPFRRE